MVYCLPQEPSLAWFFVSHSRPLSRAARTALVSSSGLAGGALSCAADRPTRSKPSISAASCFMATLSFDGAAGETGVRATYQTATGRRRIAGAGRFRERVSWREAGSSGGTGVPPVAEDRTGGTPVPPVTRLR